MKVSNGSTGSEYFLEKADLTPLQISTVLKQKIPDSYIRKIIPNAHTIHRLRPSSLHAVFKVVTKDSGEYIVRINLLKRTESQFHLDTLIPDITGNSIGKYSHNLSRKIIPHDFEIIEASTGQLFYDLFAKKKLSRKYLLKAGGILAKVHKTQGSGFGQIDIGVLKEKKRLTGNEKKWGNFIMRNLSSHILYCEKNKLITRAQSKRIKEIFDDNLDYLNSLTESRLLHGDVAYHNIILLRGKVYFIDFDDAILGDPYYDLAFYATGMDSSDSTYKNFLEGYSPKINLEDDLRFRLYFLRVALAKELIMHKWKKQRPQFKKRLANAIKLFD